MSQPIDRRSFFRQGLRRLLCSVGDAVEGVEGVVDSTSKSAGGAPRSPIRPRPAGAAASPTRRGVNVTPPPSPEPSQSPSTPPADADK